VLIYVFNVLVKIIWKMKNHVIIPLTKTL